MLPCSGAIHGPIQGKLNPVKLGISTEIAVFPRFLVRRTWLLSCIRHLLSEEQTECQTRGAGSQKKKCSIPISCSCIAPNTGDSPLRVQVQTRLLL